MNHTDDMTVEQLEEALQKAKLRKHKGAIDRMDEIYRRLDAISQESQNLYTHLKGLRIKTEDCPFRVEGHAHAPLEKYEGRCKYCSTFVGRKATVGEKLKDDLK